MTNNNLQQLNDELTNCRKAIAQALVLSGRGVVQRLRSMEKNIVHDIRQAEIVRDVRQAEFDKFTAKIIENRG